MDLFAPVKPGVLVVSHAAEELAWIAEVLRPAYRVMTCSDGVEALSLCRQNPPDLLLADVTLPDPDGYELQNCLRVDTRTSDIPVIFLASPTDWTNSQIGIDWGAESFILRPLQPQLLLARLRAFFVGVARTRALWVDNEYLEAEVQRRKAQLFAAVHAPRVVNPQPCAAHPQPVAG